MNILNIDRPQVYWLRWEAGNVAFGQGADLEQNQIISHSGAMQTFQRMLYSASEVSMAHFIIVEPLGKINMTFQQISALQV